MKIRENITQMMQYSKKSIAGFTLVELLVVIVILGLLATIGIGSFSSSQIKARDAKRKADIKSMQNALEIYFSDKGTYPLSDASGNVLGCNAEQVCSWGSEWADSNGTLYMQQLPADPKSGQYFYISDGESYQVYARLENELDRDGLGEGGWYAAPGQGACSSGDCNYGAASTNSNLGSAESQ